MKDLLELVSADERFIELAKEFEQETLYTFIDILSKTQQEMRFSNHAKVYVESALLKMIHLEPQNVPAQSAGAVNPDLLNKVEQLERMVGQLQQQLQAGVQASGNQAPSAQPRRNASKATQTVRIPTGKIHEILKAATKTDIQAIRENWAGMLQMLQKSHAALLNEAEPVAASENAFILKFKYEIHCLMASENPSLRAGLTDALSTRTGKPYEVIYVPEEPWLKVRADFIRSNGLDKQSDTGQESPEEQVAHEMMDFLQEAEQETADPFVAEAEKLFGKDFIEVHDD